MEAHVSFGRRYLLEGGINHEKLEEIIERIGIVVSEIRYTLTNVVVYIETDDDDRDISKLRYAIMDDDTLNSFMDEYSERFHKLSAFQEDLKSVHTPETSPGYIMNLQQVQRYEKLLVLIKDELKYRGLTIK